MPDDTRYGSEMARRAVMTGAGALAACAALAACGSSGSQSADVPSEAPLTPTVPAQPVPAGSTGDRLASTSDIPVGGGTVIAGKKVVVTQPVLGNLRRLLGDLHAPGLHSEQGRQWDDRLPLSREQVRHRGRFGRGRASITTARSTSDHRLG